MDPKEKENLVRSFYRGMKKQRSYEDQKLLKQISRERKQSGSKSSSNRRRRPDDWLEEDEEGMAVEKMKSHRGPVHGRKEPGPGEVRESTESDGLPEGVGGWIVAVDRGRVIVSRDGEEQEIRLDPRLRGAFKPVVGDEVSLSVGSGESSEDWSLLSILPRRTRLSRPDPSREDRERVLAANVDVAVIVTSVRNPVLKPGLIDRMVIAAESGGVSPVVAVNKIDLVTDPGARRDVSAAVDGFRDLEIPCFLLSAETEEGVEALRETMRGKTCVFVGQSGVGKSSLLNRVDPGLERRTGEVRARDGKGCHTTTRSNLVELEDGTRVIDTPGVRSFGLWNLDRGCLSHAFREFASYASACRFSDCTHRVEPDCAVREAVESGSIVPRRYRAYLRIYDSLE